MSKRNSIRAAAQSKDTKPDKPYPDYPLFAHWNGRAGRWAKKIRGKLVYFGPWEEPDAALENYNQRRADLEAGRTPRPEDDGLTVYLLCAKFLTTKKRMMDAGELSPHTFADYSFVAKLLIKGMGKNRLVSDLRPDDFERLRGRMQRTWGPVRVGNTINKARVVFSYGYKNGLMEKPMVYGEGFRRPSKKALRKLRAEQGPKMFEAAELRTMLAKATPSMKAMLLLGANCGYGNSDIGNMPLSALDLERGWTDYPRPKTGIERRCPLWPETIEALREWLKVRPEPKKDEHKQLVFLTPRGDTWAKATSDNPVSTATAKLMKECRIGGHRSYYAIRHTFQTIADDARDFVAVRKIMGHASSDIADVYRERVSDERLQAVTDHVRGWLFADAKPAEQTKAEPTDRPRLRVYRAAE